MSSRAAFRLAWGLWALYLVLGGAGVSMLVYVAVTPGPSFSEDTIWFAVVFLSGLFVFSTVGAVIASRRPENAVGWLMCAFAPLWMVQGLFSSPSSSPPDVSLRDAGPSSVGWQSLAQSRGLLAT
jgi:hypothetical protein